MREENGLVLGDNGKYETFYTTDRFLATFLRCKGYYYRVHFKEKGVCRFYFENVPLPLIDRYVSGEDRLADVSEAIRIANHLFYDVKRILRRQDGEGRESEAISTQNER